MAKIQNLVRYVYSAQILYIFFLKHIFKSEPENELLPMTKIFHIFDIYNQFKNLFLINKYYYYFINKIKFLIEL